MDYFDALQKRRSVYSIRAASTISDQQLANMLTDALKHAPSAFHSRSSRVYLLLGGSHIKLWKLVLDTLRPIVPADKFTNTEQKVSSFAAGYGTILYYEDQAVVAQLQEQFPLYRDSFPTWSEQSSGMLQYMVWTGLAAEGLGATLQHYNPLIDDAVASHFGIPATWKLIAQMPFGVPTAPPEDKNFGDVDARVHIVNE